MKHHHLGTKCYNCVKADRLKMVRKLPKELLVNVMTELLNERPEHVLALLHTLNRDLGQ